MVGETYGQLTASLSHKFKLTLPDDVLPPIGRKQEVWFTCLRILRRR